MSCGSCGTSCGTGCAGCKVVGAIVALLLTLTSIAALIGVYVTHVTPDGWMFGSLNGSVAILTLVASLMAWLKLVKKMCPCRKGSCGTGSCPGCGKEGGACECR